MQNIEINISNKIATLKEKFVGVCGNSDYVVVFDFDDEWKSHATKTARFKYGGQYTDVVFTGNECPMPIILDTASVEIGVYAGNLHTTTSACVLMKTCILSGSGVPADPIPDVYNQIIDKIDAGMLKGEDGVSPSVEVSKSGDTTTIAITDASGVHTAEIKDGSKGGKGDKGDKGDNGAPGKDGSDANVTAENIQSALGYAPVTPSDLAAKQDVLTDADKQSITKIGMTTGTAWTADEQKAARERMGVDKEFATFEARMSKVFNALLKQNMNWNAVAELVRAGMGEAAFAVGSQFAVQHSVFGTLLFDVAAHNHHKKPGDPDTPTMTLLMHHCIYGRQIDASELLWANTGDSALAAGAYNFTLYKGSNGGQTYEDGTYQFTTTKPIPAGGGWTHNKVGVWYSNAADYKPENITSGTVTTYDASGTVLESGLAVTAGSDGTALGTASNAKADCVNTIGTFNSIMRRVYGSNNWAESAARQWLNSSAAANSWWQRQTIFDLVPNYANKAGFLAGLDPDFVDALGAVDITTARNTVYEMGDTLGGSYTTRDKLFLPSMAEIGLGSNNSVAEGSVLPLYDGATQTDRIKYDQAAQTTARYWWLRSPFPWHADSVRIVFPSGALSDYGATVGGGLAAACVIY